MPTILCLTCQVLLQVGILLVIHYRDKALSGKFAQMVRVVSLLWQSLLSWTPIGSHGGDLLLFLGASMFLVGSGNLGHLEENFLSLPVQRLLGLLDARDWHLVLGLSQCL